MSSKRPMVPIDLHTFHKRSRHRRLRWLRIAAIPILAMAVMISLRTLEGGTPPVLPITSSDADQEQAAGPPWHYGRADADFTLTLYADLECPFCRSYFPVVTAWIDQRPEVNLQWHHLPLASHEPAATDLARIAECAGETGGNRSFFDAIGWLYRHTRGGGLGLPDSLRYPSQTPAMQACLESTHPENTVRTQAQEGARSGIAATPTVRLQRRDNGRSLLLHGPVDGDALLSAMDLLLTDISSANPGEQQGLSAVEDGDIPK